MRPKEPRVRDKCGRQGGDKCKLPPCLPLRMPWAAWVYTCLPLVSHTCLSLWVPWAAWVYTCLPLVCHSGFLGPHEFTLVSHMSPTCLPHLSPTLGSLGRMGLHLSPPCLPLWVPWAAWVYTCLPLVSHSGCLGPHEFTLVSSLPPTLGALGRMSLHLSPICLPHLSPTLGSCGRMSLHLSPPCLSLWVPWGAWVYTCLLLVSHSGVPWAAWVYTCLPHLSPTLGALGRMSLHLSPTCLPHLSPTLGSLLWVLGPHEFTLVSPLSPTLGALGRMSLHLSPTCLPLWIPWAAWVYTCLPLVSHSGCLGPHEFTLVSPLSPTLGSLGRMSLHLSPPCLPHLSLTLGALGRMSLHLSPPCLPLWVPWAAWVYTCLPLVSHSGCLGPHEFKLVSHLSPTLGSLGRMSLHSSPPCLPLWVPWAAWVYTCLPHLSPTLVSHTCLPHGFLGPHEFTLVSLLSPTLEALGRMSLHLSPTCLVSHICFPLWVPCTLVSPLSPTLGAMGRMSLHLSPTCLPLVSSCLPLWVPSAAWVYTYLPLSPTLGALGRMSLHLSPPCLPLWVPWAAWVYTCLLLASHSGCLGPHEFTLVSPLSPTLGALGRMNLHLSPPCLPLWVPWAAWVYTCLPLVSHSGCLGPHEFTLVYGTQGTQSGRQEGDKCKLMRPKAPRVGDKGETSVNSRGPRHREWETRGAQSGRQVWETNVGDKCKLPPCLPLWVPWAAWVYTCLPHLSPTLVSHSGPPLSPTLGALGRVSLHLSMRPKAPRVGDKGETSVQGTQSGKQGGDKRHPERQGGRECKLMRPKAPRVGDTHAAQGTRVGDKGETSVNSCGPRHPEWETRGRQV